MKVGLEAPLRERDLRVGELVVEGQLLEGEVVGVDVLSGGDRDAGAPDHLAVAVDHFAGRDRTERDLVTGGNGVARRSAAVRRCGVRFRPGWGRARWRRCRRDAGGWRNSRPSGVWRFPEAWGYRSSCSSGESLPRWTWNLSPAGCTSRPSPTALVRNPGGTVHDARTPGWTPRRRRRAAGRRGCGRGTGCGVRCC